MKFAIFLKSNLLFNSFYCLLLSVYKQNFTALFVLKRSYICYKIICITALLCFDDHSRLLCLPTLLKKRLWHRCFPVNFVKFLRTRFHRTPLGGCLWKIWSKKYFPYHGTANTIQLVVAIKRTFSGLLVFGPCCNIMIWAGFRRGSSNVK